MAKQKSFRKLRKWFFPYTVSTCMVACRNFLITGLTALIGSRVLQAAVEGKQRDFFGQLAYLALLIGVFLVFDTLGVFWQSTVIHGIQNELRGMLYKSVLGARYDKMSVLGQKGELLSRMHGDVDMVTGILSGGILMPLMGLISGVGATITIAAIHWKLCLALYGIEMVCWVGRVLVIRRERTTIDGLQKNKAAALGFAGEHFQNSLTVRLCNLTEAFEEKVLRNLAGFECISRRFAAQKTLEGAGATLLQYLQSVGMLFVGYFLFQRGEIKLQDTVILYQMAGLITMMVNMLSDGYASFQSWSVGFGRLREILELEEEKDGPMAKAKPFIREAADGVAAEGITCRLGNFTVYEDLWIRFGNEGLYLLTGESGKGKTTFFRLLTGLYPCQAGELRLFGRKIEEYTKKSTRMQITYMTQENALFQGTVRDNLLWRNRVEDAKIWALLERLGLQQWMLSLEKGLDTGVSNGGNEFSGGQQKCLLLARALLEDSAVYLLDEAFAGVDWQHQDRIWQELVRVAQRALVIVITHDSSLLEWAGRDGATVVTMGIINDG